MSKADASVKGAEAIARAELGDALSKFVLDCVSGEIRKQLGRNPNSRDLVETFKRYALAVFNAEASERVADLDSTQEYQTVLAAIADSVVAKIRGMWRQAVELACDDENVIVFGDSLSGFYYPSNLIRPQLSSIRGALRRRSEKLQGELAPSERRKRHLLTRSQAVEQGRPQYPGRAKWLRKMLLDRSWSTLAVEEKYDGPDHKTVQRMLDGHKVQEGTLDKLANALSNSKKHPPVTVAQIPQD